MVTLKSGQTMEPGCFIDGHWGQYGIARMIEIAADMGWTDKAAEPGLGQQKDGIKLAMRKLASMSPSDSDSEDLTDSEEEELIWAADDAEAWLNEQTPEGYSWGWQDGEFFLSSAEWWEEEG